MGVTINDIYNQLKYHHLDDDVNQDVAIKIWMSLDQFDPEKGQLSTWVSRIVKNHLITISRSKAYKESKSTNALSEFSKETDDGEIDFISQYLTSKELNPEESMITSELREELLKRIYGLPGIYSKVMFGIYSGMTPAELSSELDVPVNTVRAQISRGKKMIRDNNKKKFKYILTNLETGKKYYLNTYAAVAEKAGCCAEAVRYSLNKSGVLKKKWTIKLNK